MNTKIQSACCFTIITFLRLACSIAVAAELAPPPMAVAPFAADTAKQHQQAWATYLGVPVEWTNSIGMRFTLIPPGEFMMGSSQEEFENMAERFPDLKDTILEAELPQHRVRLTNAFYLGMTEVTQAEYERVMGDTLGHFKTAPTHAVGRATWDDAVAYCQKLGELSAEQASRAVYRLPTEAEWEYACRAGTTTWCSGVDEEAGLQEQAWNVARTGNAVQFGFQVGRTRDHVAQKTPNAWGLYDMHGNVWEWCSDRYDRAYYADSPLDDPQGPARGSRRVCRGGSWFRDDASFCRASFRFGLPPGVCQGFRLARTVSAVSR
jgi:formylglycine-generating enzyme required for sulfatase activity